MFLLPDVWKAGLRRLFFWMVHVTGQQCRSAGSCHQQAYRAAREQGYRYLILESGEPLVAAMALYRKLGYEIIPNYGQYKDMPDSICMKKKL